MRTISQRQLRNDSAAILRDVQGGERIVVTRNGTPVAELGPILRRQFVPRSAIAAAARTAPRIDFARFRADLDTVADSYVDVSDG
ncbi:MAG: type II toxin-antitoxin system Phd/YefM family antitoxin [Acidobacteria bacterium]|nr:type II toxin-antitoxin system Phd/YefM family antitoxin [Acidobacteriota bacterium]MXZ72445.1 type II toxin-antitoxin system Phd/YefM family antitoxin [Acidobacteriota bacterium]MYD70218.1 type II toxin-antitoxin system Phd/YefM family antitoxin [Acidobacteriota bacterium]MYJ05807.1 type II toxin-antitoxin system Phd/YefM family antitoxin [Acidobacteriota bacterium]